MYLPILDLNNINCVNILSDDNILVEYNNGTSEIFYPAYNYISSSNSYYTCSNSIPLDKLTNEMWYHRFIHNPVIIFTCMFIIFYLLVKTALYALFGGF